MAMTTIDQLVQILTDASERYGGDTPVAIECDERLHNIRAEGAIGIENGPGGVHYLVISVD